MLWSWENTNSINQSAIIISKFPEGSKDKLLKSQMYMRSSRGDYGYCSLILFCLWQWGENQVTFMENMHKVCLWLLLFFFLFNWKSTVTRYSSFLIKSSSMHERGWMHWGFSCFHFPPSSFILHTSGYIIIRSGAILAGRIADSRLACTWAELPRS